MDYFHVLLSDIEIDVDITVAQDRDEDSGKFTEQYPEEAFLEAVEQNETTTTTQIAEEVGCSYDLAYRRLNTLVDEGKVQRKEIGPSFVWSTA
jgi:predicted HTH transcriptional regulator